MQEYGKIDFNAKAAKRTKKEDWIKDHEHFADHVDLGAKWEELQNVETPAEEEKPAKTAKVKAPKKAA